MNRLRAYLAELRTPVRYTGYAGTVNQFGHAGIGALAAAVYMGLGLAGDDALGAALVAFPVAYLVAWEIPRMTDVGQARDVAGDTLFVLIGGAAAVLAGAYWPAPAFVAAGLFGIWTARA